MVDTDKPKLKGKWKKTNILDGTVHLWVPCCWCSEPCQALWYTNNYVEVWCKNFYRQTHQWCRLCLRCSKIFGLEW